MLALGHRKLRIEIRTVSEHRPGHAHGLVGQCHSSHVGVAPYCDAYQQARDIEAKSNSVESRLEALRKQFPDIAELIDSQAGENKQDYFGKADCCSHCGTHDEICSRTCLIVCAHIKPLASNSSQKPNFKGSSIMSGYKIPSR